MNNTLAKLMENIGGGVVLPPKGFVDPYIYDTLPNGAYVKRQAKHVMDGSRLRDWAATARRGDRITYFIGFLTVDRDAIFNYLRNRAEINNVANAAYELYKAGRLMLFQRKRDDNVYEYIAVRK